MIFQEICPNETKDNVKLNNTVRDGGRPCLGYGQSQHWAETGSCRRRPWAMANIHADSQALTSVG